MRLTQIVVVTLVVATAYLIMGSCNKETAGDILLQGKIIVPTMEDEFTIYVNSDTPTSSFKFAKKQNVEFSGVNWLNRKDALIGTESIAGFTSIEERCNIVEFDMSGNVTSRIYEAAKGELAWPEHSSWDDRYFIFTTHNNADPHIYPFEALAPMVSLVIMDLKQKKVITKIDSVGRMPNFKIEESPWLKNGYRFVFSTDGETQFKVKGDQQLINPTKGIKGIYMYDVVSNVSTLLVPGARSAIASPAKDEIAYQKDDAIRVMDLTSGREKIVYAIDSKETLRGMHWTPDGKYIYLLISIIWGLVGCSTLAKN